MRCILFFFLLLLPGVVGIAVSPASLTFQDGSAELYIVNDHTLESHYIVQGSVLKQDISIPAREKKLVKLKLRKDALESGVVEVREVSSVSGFSVVAGLDVPYGSHTTTVSERVQEVSNKVTGNVARSVKSSLPENNLWMYAVGGIIILAGAGWWIFSEKKVPQKSYTKFENKKPWNLKKFNKQESNNKKGWKNAGRLKYNRIR